MHRKTVVTAACGAVAVLAVGLTGPAAQARAIDADGFLVGPVPRPGCPAPPASAGVTADRHVASYLDQERPGRRRRRPATARWPTT